MSETNNLDDHPGPKLGFLLNDLARAVTTVYDARLKHAKLTRSQWRAVAYVSRTPGISQIKLADELGVGRMAVTGVLNRLESKNLLIRKQDPSDRRAKQVYCTTKAKKLLPSMQKVGNEVINDIIEGLSPMQQQQIMKGLTKMYNNALQQI